MDDKIKILRWWNKNEAEVIKEYHIAVRVTRTKSGKRHRYDVCAQDDDPNLAGWNFISIYLPHDQDEEAKKKAIEKIKGMVRCGSPDIHMIRNDIEEHKS